MSICPICRTRFADFPEQDFTINEDGIIAKSKEAHECRMKVFWNDEKRFCSDECSDAFLQECESRQLERELGFDRRMREGWL